jgi:RND family efflux transporter MFP subunit
MPEATNITNGKGAEGKIRHYFFVLLAIALLLAVWGEVSRMRAHSKLIKESAAAAIPAVFIVSPTRATQVEDLVLPGSVQAFIDAPIYARTSGYLKAWYTDIGSQVVKGQLLGEIEAPEVDQQFSQAQADLATARANESLSNTTNVRWIGLLSTESVSQQDADEKAGDAAAKRAAADSAAANLARLRELESFKRVVAPFTGVVTVRNTDVGALINAGQSAGFELFHVADIRRLRIFVQVPEIYAGTAAPGVEAELHFAEHPGKAYLATIVRTSNSLDPILRTLLVELQLGNANGEVFPGAYAEVHFKLAADATILRLPANTVLFRSAGLQVATVDAQNHVKLKSFAQGRDFGNAIEILSGLSSDDAVILNPPDSITDGTLVRISGHST